MRHAQNSFSSLSTPSLDSLLELSPHAPFFIAEVPPTGVPLLPRSSHLGASVFLLRCATETPRKRSSVAVP